MKEVKILLQQAFAEAVKYGVLINEVKFDYHVVKTISNPDEIVLNKEILDCEFVRVAND